MIRDQSIMIVVENSIDFSHYFQRIDRLPAGSSLIEKNCPIIPRLELSKSMDRYKGDNFLMVTRFCLVPYDFFL